MLGGIRFNTKRKDQVSFYFSISYINGVEEVQTRTSLCPSPSSVLPRAVHVTGRTGKTRCVYETFMPLKQPFFSKHVGCIVFNAIFKSISIILWQPVHLSMPSWSSFNQYSAQYSFQATGCFPT